MYLLRPGAVKRHRLTISIQWCINVWAGHLSLRCFVRTRKHTHSVTFNLKLNCVIEFGRHQHAESVCSYVEHIMKYHPFLGMDLIIDIVSSGAVRSAASSYAAMRTVAGSRPVLVIVWEWHIGLALLCGCSGALEYPTTNSCGLINKSLILNPYRRH